jgi:hypothetical protein
MTSKKTDNNSTDCYVSDKNRCRVKTLKTKSTIAKGTKQKQNTKKHIPPPRPLKKNLKKHVLPKSKKHVLPKSWGTGVTGKRLELLQKHYELWVEVRDRGILLHDWEEHYMLSPENWRISPLQPSMSLKEMKFWLDSARKDFNFQKNEEEMNKLQKKI